MTRNADSKSTRGYFGVAIWYPKTSCNVGTLWRSASILDAAFLATIGHRYHKQPSDTIQSARHTPLWHFDTPEDFWAHVPTDCATVAIELHPRARMLPHVHHPERAIYLLGPEDGDLPPEVVRKATQAMQIPGKYCYNVAVAGSIVLYDRIAKASARESEP